MQVRLFPVFAFSLIAGASAQTQDPAIDLAPVTVFSPRVALQEPTGTFAMPVSALRFEPLVDVQGRNMAEGQADIAIRGGIFENSGFKVGALSLYDPLTGHYFAEIPVAPAMLTAPSVVTGAENAAHGWNATTGTVAYQWRPIRATGVLSLSAGQHDTWRGEIYQGLIAPDPLFGGSLAADFSVGYSKSDGSRPWGESEFSRYNIRFQLQRDNSQTDLFFGTQFKEFGWPNLYTPFANVFETEDIHTTLLLLSHRIELPGDDYVSFGGYYRYNNDHYVFNRPEAGAYNPAFATGPAFHRTWVYTVGAEGRISTGEVRWNFTATAVDDSLSSTSLVFGRYKSRQHYKVAVVPERTWTVNGRQQLHLKAGATYDDTNRDGSSVSPVAEVALDGFSGETLLQRVYASFSRSTQTATYFALNSASNRGLFRGNPNLARQVAKNYEIGIEGGQGPWAANAAVFFRRDDGLVDWTYAAGAPNARAANPVDIDTSGFELVARYETRRVDVVFGYAALNKDADYGLAAVDASFYALNFPEHRATLALIARLGGGWEVRMDNEYRIQDRNALRTSDRTPWISSAGVYYSVRQIKGLRLSAEVENLWDSDFQEVPAVPSARRQLSLGLVYHW